MDQNQRPHSRKKTVGSGSAGVGKGSSTGGGPVGSGGHSQGGSGGSSGRASIPFLGGGKLSLKTILIIVAAIVVLSLVFKGSGGGLLSGLTSENGIAHLTDTDYSYSDESFAAYSKPDYSVSDLAREKRVTPVGGGKDTVTVMVYMCGTDLESKYGMATKDLQEMLSAKLSDKVNLIVETGGCSKWKNSTISSSKNQIYKVENGGLRCLEKDAGTAAMTDPNNLTTFIKYCVNKYPADRNMLIFWDHGGGSISGYGYDEKKPNSSSMTLSKINTALKNANCEFDFIGYDACLMATLENALVCNNYADYLIASEETEPGTGWYYKNWLTELSQNTSVSTVDLAQTIIDDFVASCKSGSAGANVTLSLIDLAELDGTVPEAFNSFASSTTDLIKSDDYKKVSEARAGVRQFSKESRINQVDLIDLAQRIDTKESKALAKALHGCVKYNQSTMTRCNGVSIFFPYESTSSVKSAVASYKDLGIDGEYSDCIKSFASLNLGGQLVGSATQMPDLTELLGGLTGGSSGSGDLLGTLLSSYLGGTTSSASSTSTSPIGTLLGSFLGGSSSSSSAAGSSIDPTMLINLLGSFTGRSMPAEYDWVDTQLIADNAKNIANDFLDPAHLAATEKNGKKVLSLTDEEWGLVQTVELNVFVNDGDGYIDLGLDNTFEFDDDGDLRLDFDGTWLTLNGNVCSYYMVSDTKQEDGSWTTIGRIPAILNGQTVNLQVVFNDEHNVEGTVTGAYPMYDNIDVQAKGCVEIKAGDRIQLLCDYYGLDGNYSDSYTLGDSFTVPQSGLKLENLSIEAEDVRVTYRITDIYDNSYWVSAD